MTEPVETYRATMMAATPETGRETVLVMRRDGRVWLTLQGSIRATVILTAAGVGQLRRLLSEASEASGTRR